MNSFIPVRHLRLVPQPVQTAIPQKAVLPEEEIEEPPEDNLRAIDPEDLANDGGWWFQCRSCERHTRIRSKIPSCRYCGFSQNQRGVR